MRVSTAIRSLPSSVRDALPPNVASDLQKWVQDCLRDYESAVNGGLELGENLGVVISGTFNVVANTAVAFAHGLGRVPVFFAYYCADTNVIPAPVIYAEAATMALWTADAISLKCSRDTSVTSLSVVVFAA